MTINKGCPYWYSACASISRKLYEACEASQPFSFCAIYCFRFNKCNEIIYEVVLDFLGKANVHSPHSDC